MKLFKYILLTCISTLFIAICSNAQVVMTNLNDELNTTIELNPTNNINIDELSQMSSQTDEHMRQNTLLTDMSVYVPHVTKIIIGQQFSLDDRFYLDLVALRRFGIKYAIVDKTTSKDIILKNLSCNILFVGNSLVNSLNTSYPNISQLNASSLDANSLNISKLIASKIDLAIIDYTSFDINTFNIDIPKADVTEQTYAELNELNLAYEFEQDHNKNAKMSTQLTDLKKLDMKLYVKWINKLMINKTCNIKFIKDRSSYKIAGEAWIPNKHKYDENAKINMLANLSILKSKGYDSILVRFDCNEDHTQLMDMVDDIKQSGFKVFASYVGQDGLCPKWNPYIEPDVLEDYISSIAPRCQGFFLNWRSMSNHAKMMPIEFFNYMCNTLRKFNNKISIYGEIYYGHVDPYYCLALVYTAPTNITGVVINNVGYVGYNIAQVANQLYAKVVPQYGRMQKIGQVIGAGPYYCSRLEYNLNLSLEKEYQYKHEVEKAFKKIGCSTMTFIHDGVDDHFTQVVGDPKGGICYDTTDNILFDTKLQIQKQEN